MTPDDHVDIGFHEVLSHYPEEEELLFVALSELGRLRLDWPKIFLHSCPDISLIWIRCARNAGSGLVPHSRGSVVSICSRIWANTLPCITSSSRSCGDARSRGVRFGRGTAKDCVDHMRRAHDIPPSVKAANLPRWFPPWKVTREQWTSMSRQAVSGIAVDTLLLSRIGVPLFHRYRVVNRSGTHGAFHGSYIRRLHAFLEKSDAASLRRRHRRCARDIAARMLRTSIRDTEDRTPYVSSRPKIIRARRKCAECGCFPWARPEVRGRVRKVGVSPGESAVSSEDPDEH